jgi:hypothetical protein
VHKEEQDSNGQQGYSHHQRSDAPAPWRGVGGCAGWRPGARGGRRPSLNDLEYNQRRDTVAGRPCGRRRPPPASLFVHSPPRTVSRVIDRHRRQPCHSALRDPSPASYAREATSSTTSWTVPAFALAPSPPPALLRRLGLRRDHLRERDSRERRRAGRDRQRTHAEVNLRPDEPQAQAAMVHGRSSHRPSTDEYGPRPEGP